MVFALLGAIGCLLAAVGLEALFTATRLGEKLDDRVSPVLILRSELRRRMEEAGGRSGEVQISLAWNNTNDLDLSCISPLGEEVGYDKKRVPSGGELDVDCNSSEPLTRRALENIRWPYGRAPAGRYRVYVKLFKSNPDPLRQMPEVDATPFRLVVLVQGHSYEVRGTIRKADDKLLVYEFDTRNDHFVLGRLLPAILQTLLLTGVWTAVVVTLLTLLLVWGQSQFYRRYYDDLLFKRDEARDLVGWGGLSGLCGGVVGQLVCSLLALYAPGVSAASGRQIGWAALGVVVGALLSRRMPNLPLRTAWIGGVVGGIGAGLLLHRSLAEGTGMEGRIEGATLLGVLIGLMIVLMIPEENEDEEDQDDEVDLRMHLVADRLRINRRRATGTLRRKRLR